VRQHQQAAVHRVIVEAGPAWEPRWRPRIEVLVRASPDALSAFGEVFGDAVRRALDAAPPTDEHGFRSVTLTFEHEAAAVQRSAGFGGQVEVLSPAAVRDRLIATARELVEHYRMLGCE
jgi:predicted DNA-binding transcriptional regulator YafY